MPPKISLSKHRLRGLIAVVGVLATIAVISLVVGRRTATVAAPAAEIAAPAAIEPDTFGFGDVPADVVAFLEQGQSWRAAVELRRFIERNAAATPAAVLLAARAEADWGGWNRVLTYLEDADWKDSVGGGDGWYWLARALEEQDREEEAIRAYSRYLDISDATASGDRRLKAELRQGLLLFRTGQQAEGAARMDVIRTQAPELSVWVELLAAEALAQTGDSARVRALVERPARHPELQLRAWRAHLEASEGAGDPAAARRVAVQYAPIGATDAVRAEMLYHAGRLALEMGDVEQARRDWRAALSVPASAGARRAADGLASQAGLSPADRLTIARVQDRHGDRRSAAAGYRSWLAAGSGSVTERVAVRLALGQALFGLGDYPAVESELRSIRDGSTPEAAAAMLLIGRAQYRRGNHAQATQTFDQLANRFPGSGPGSEGLYLIADLAHDRGETARAAPLYRRVASDFRGTDRAELSLMRLAGMRFLARDYPAAGAIWEEYRRDYPEGVRWLEATYWAGRSREEMGDVAGAHALYRAVKARDPLSYYSLRSSERLGEPFWPIPRDPSPPENREARDRIGRWMRSIDLLRDAGLHTEAELEADRWIRHAGSDESLLYPLAETLNERGYTLRGIRIGQQLQRDAERPNDRMLRILYPFPYRGIVEAEAREKGLDPFMVAALTRQESLFKARITSPVGARGLMQVMPQTGAAIARGAGIQPWDSELLFQPEINVHLGTRYLADQMRSYRGSLPSVFSAYNAGPLRINEWSSFPEYRDEELFTERIPFRETRDYVKILTRNIALYRALY